MEVRGLAGKKYSGGHPRSRCDPGGRPCGRAGLGQLRVAIGRLAARWRHRIGEYGPSHTSSHAFSFLHARAERLTKERPDYDQVQTARLAPQLLALNPRRETTTPFTFVAWHARSNSQSF